MVVRSRTCCAPEHRTALLSLLCCAALHRRRRLRMGGMRRRRACGMSSRQAGAACGCGMQQQLSRAYLPAPGAACPVVPHCRLSLCPAAPLPLRCRRSARRSSCPARFRRSEAGGLPQNPILQELARLPTQPLPQLPRMPGHLQAHSVPNKHQIPPPTMHRRPPHPGGTTS